MTRRERENLRHDCADVNFHAFKLEVLLFIFYQTALKA
jgi:hypothetical protein